MLDKIPSDRELQQLLGGEKFAAWVAVRELVDSLYDMEAAWNTGGKRWTYECKYRRGGKTLCALYAREDCFGLLVVFGKDERDKFESGRGEFSAAVQAAYDGAKTYHDGKWMMLEPGSAGGMLLTDVERLLAVKRRPNRK